jgi:methyltransferase family protein
VPFRSTFDCLWCGTSYVARGPDEIEGWAQLCSDCVAKAGDNGFLRFRLRDAITERGRAAVPAGVQSTAADVGDDGLVAYYEARAPEYDDWYLRRGRYERGPIHDAAWNAELDTAGRWLDGLPISGQIVELAAGTGWWSPLLAGKGELSIYDAAETPLDRARDRLLAHGLRAHIHTRDAWAEPDRAVDALFTGFWLSHIQRDRLPEFLCPIRSRERRTIRRPSRTARSGGSTTVVSSRSSRSTTRRTSWRRRCERPASLQPRSRQRAASSCWAARPPDCDGRGRAPGRGLYSARCRPCRSARSPRSVRASWPRP